MAVSARFLADFTQFNAAVQQANVKLKDFTTGSAAVEKQLSRMTDSFSGRKLIQDATMAAEAIDRIGGTSKLTESELRRVSAQAKEATDKLRAMGQDVPERLQNLANAADQGSTKVSLLQRAASMAGPALTAMAGAFTAGAIISAIRNTGEWAGRIDDLSKKMGISVEAVQRLDFAARQNGSSIEQVSAALAQMGNRLVEGGRGTIAALQKLNLQLGDLQRMAPDEAFKTLARSIAAIPDPMQRSQVAMELFGRAGADLLPIMGRLESDMADAVVASRDMINAGDRLGDSWDKIKGSGTLIIASVLTPLEPALTLSAKLINALADGWLRYLAITKVAMTQQPPRPAPAPGMSGGAFGDAKAGGGFGPSMAQMTKEQAAAILAKLERFAPMLRTTGEMGIIRFDNPEVFAQIEAGLTKTAEAKIKATIATEKATLAEKEWTAAVVAASQGQVMNLARWAALPPAIADASARIRESLSTIAGAGQNESIFDRLVGARPGTVASQGISATLAKSQSAFQSFFSGLKGGFQSIWEGMSGGKGISGLFSNLGGGLMQGFGNLLSGGLSSLISGGVGKAVKGVTSLFGKLFGGDSKELKAAKSAYAEMQREAARLGITLERTFNLKSVEDYEKAISRAQAQINRLMDEQAADAERLTKAIEKYGFSFEQLGPALQQQRLHEQATELIEDWRVLVAAGIELTTVNERMADSINEYLRLAIRTGMEVPRAFEPILQQMIDQGLLLDENGEAITDLGQLQIKWAETMTEGFDRVVAKLQELIDKLQATGTAIADIPNTIPIDVVYNDPGPPNRDEPLVPMLSMSGSQLATIDRGTSSGGGGAATSGGDLYVTLEVDGQRMADKVVRLMPDRLGLMGVR